MSVSQSKPGFKLFPRLNRSQQKALSGYLFILPWMIGFIAFTAGPVLVSLVMSFFKYNMLSDPTFIGFENFMYMFTKDRQFWGAIQRTAYFALSVVLIGITGSLSLALLVNSKIPGKGIFRTSFFIPTLTPVIAAALLWLWILEPTYGVLNTALKYIGITGPAWLQSTQWAIPGIILIYLWLNLGGGNMIILLAGLQNVPQELYDASNVDGANAWERFVNVTLPILSPTLFYVLVVGVIGGLKVFALPYMASAKDFDIGGPEYATWFYLIHLYVNAFKYLQMGYASALAWIFFIAVLVITIIQFRASSRWVYYEAGDN